MKRSFVSHGSLDLIHPNDPTNISNHNNFSITYQVPISKPISVVSQFASSDLSQFIDNHEPTAALDGFVSIDSSYLDCYPNSTNFESHCLKSSRIHYVNDQACNEHGLSLMKLLMECAVVISHGNLDEAKKILLELSVMASPYSPSAAERIVAYFAHAMSSRVMSSWLGSNSLHLKHLVQQKNILSVFHTFNNISPFIKFAHFTANQAILEAFHLKDKVHIVDLDVMQGLQWPALFHILANRPDGPPHVRMTGMGSSASALAETGSQLSSFARRLGLPFEFHPINGRAGGVDPSAIHVRRGETVAVHWLQHSLYDSIGTVWKTMRLFEYLAPTIISLVEQELVVAGSFLDRFISSIHYYSTVFDALSSSLHDDDIARYKVEQGLLSKEISNILDVGGGKEETFPGWRIELMNGGFSQVPISSRSTAQAQLVLNAFPSSHGYTIQQGNGTLRLGWKGTALYTASAWTWPHLQ